tara:strand:- start:2108 stop:3037 length:930 start_codon:yes stop_codon:yes gene_type:complete
MLLVFGSINMDIVVCTKGFPAPGETLLGGQYKVLDGGKGANQAIAAQRTGASKTYMVGCVGHDRYGDDVLHNMRVHNVVPSGVGRSNTSTGLAIICVNEEGENSVIVSSGANMDAKADQIPDSFYTPDNVFLMQMELDPEQNWIVTERAHDAGSKIILNVAPALPVPIEVLDKIDYLIVNEHEATELARIFKVDHATPAELAVRLAQKFSLSCIVTMSDKGSFASESGKNLIRGHSMKVDAIDTTGAGDAFCGTFAACIEQKFAFKKALHYASVSGALTCTEMGAQNSMPNKKEIEENLENCAPPEEAS